MPRLAGIAGNCGETELHGARGLSPAKQREVLEHLTVLHGSVEVEVGTDKKKVKLGGTARYPADINHVIRNTGKTEAKALLVVVHR